MIIKVIIREVMTVMVKALIKAVTEVVIKVILKAKKSDTKGDNRGGIRGGNKDDTKSGKIVTIMAVIEVILKTVIKGDSKGANKGGDKGDHKGDSKGGNRGGKSYTATLLIVRRFYSRGSRLDEPRRVFRGTRVVGRSQDGKVPEPWSVGMKSRKRGVGRGAMYAQDMTGYKNAVVHMAWQKRFYCKNVRYITVLGLVSPARKLLLSIQ